MKQIAVVTMVHNLNVGGTQRIAQNYAIAYKKHGLDSRVLTVESWGIREKMLREYDIPCACVMEDKIESIRIFLDQKIDLVHIHGYANYSRIWFDILSEIKKKHPNVRVIETNVFSRPEYTGLSELIDLHMHLSDWGMIKWKLWSGGNDKKYGISSVVPNIIDLNSISYLDGNDKSRIRLFYDIPPDAFVAIRVGQPNPAKWSPHAFRAFLSFNEIYSDSIFIVVGAPRKYSSRFVHKCIRFIDGTLGDDKLTELYNIADVFLHSSAIGESFGIVFAEAGLARLPVVTLATPLKDNAQTEVVQHGETGLIANDGRGMLEALILLRKSNELRKTFGEEGRKRVCNNYSETTVLGVLFSTLLDMISFPVPDLISDRIRLPQGSRVSDADVVNRTFSERNIFFGKPPSIIKFILFKLIHSPKIYKFYFLIKRALTSARRAIFG